MSMSLKANAAGTQGEILLNGNPVEVLTASGVQFCKNKLFNGEVTRINQRGFDGNWTPKNTWNSGNTIAQQELCYGYDMWAKASASTMCQLIEAGNFRPSTVHTLSGTGVTTQQITSPASGNWKIEVPQGATNVQVEEGSVATPFEIRPTGFELAQCQRYYELGTAFQDGAIAYVSGLVSIMTRFSVPKRTSPSIPLTSNASNNLGTLVITSYGATAFMIRGSGVTLANANINVVWSASAVI